MPRNEWNGSSAALSSCHIMGYYRCKLWFEHTWLYCIFGGFQFPGFPELLVFLYELLKKSKWRLIYNECQFDLNQKKVRLLVECFTEYKLAIAFKSKEKLHINWWHEMSIVRSWGGGGWFVHRSIQTCPLKKQISGSVVFMVEEALIDRRNVLPARMSPWVLKDVVLGQHCGAAKGRQNFWLTCWR